jgi:hypothetical protein
MVVVDGAGGCSSARFKKSNTRFYLSRRHLPFQSIISLMMANPSNDLVLLRAEIAARAARLVAQDGADYGTAKRKALRMVLGEEPAPPNLMPDNAEIEEEVRKYQALFLSDSQPARLRQLRALALEVMQQLAQFRPYLTGAALNGTAGEHDDVHLQLFADSAKDVIMFLLDRDVNMDISETPHFKGGRHDPVETVSFHWRQQQVHAELYEMNDLRGALRPRADGRPQRADINAVRAMLDAPDTVQPSGSK